MSQILEIPLVIGPQVFNITLNQVAYQLTVVWRDAPAMNGGYVLDVADSLGNPIVQGIPLVTGADLLAQYGYLGIGGQLVVQTDYDLNAVPLYGNLGATAHLYWVSD
jgi:hypothetical protein